MGLRDRAIASLIAAAFALAAPAAQAQKTSPPSPELRNAIGAALDAARSNDCTGVLAALDPVVANVPEGTERIAIQRMRLPCLGGAARIDELKAAYAELAKALPRDGLVRSYGVMIAAAEDRYAEAAEQLAVLAESDPASLRLVTGNSWRGIAQKLTEQERYPLRDRVYIALARADWQPQDNPDMRDHLARGAIDALIGQGNTEEAARLLDRVDMPELLTGMAMERRYAALWPAVEERLGPAGGKAVDRFARAKLEAFARQPDDTKTMREAVRAFVLLGRPAEAIEISERIPVAEGMDEDQVVALRYEAQSLVSLGRRDEAIDRMAALAKLDLARTPSAGAGLVVHAELLDEAGRSEEAVAAARTGIAKGGTALSPWGVAWLERTEACALSAMGRAGDAAAAVAPLVKEPARNEAATIEALLCLKRDAEAAKIAVATLATPQEASNIIDQFQPDGALGLPVQSRLRALWVPFLARPDVKAAFGKAGRILPRTLWPAREPRPIPRSQRPFDAGPIA